MRRRRPQKLQLKQRPLLHIAFSVVFTVWVNSIPARKRVFRYAHHGKFFVTLDSQVTVDLVGGSAISWLSPYRHSVDEWILLLHSTIHFRLSMALRRRQHPSSSLRSVRWYEPPTILQQQNAAQEDAQCYICDTQLNSSYQVLPYMFGLHRPPEQSACSSSLFHHSENLGNQPKLLGCLDASRKSR
ncbi:hypothetical protein EDD15DRAFT_791504 [Pisolithus albus]|nr:hypothetical protein EDD15DRAFT_791504 [Pisolithus albus]